MRILGKLLPFFISVAITPFALVAGLGTAVEGDFFYTKLVFPYTVLLAALFRVISNPVPDSTFGILFVLMVIQFPIYGMIISLVERRDVAVEKVAGIHVGLSVLSFVVSYLSKF